MAIQGTRDAFLRYRVGDYRLLYEIHDDDHVVLVAGIVARKDLEGWIRLGMTTPFGPTVMI